MTPRRRRRLIVALCVLFGAMATTTLTVLAFRENMLFFYTPTQIQSGEIDSAGKKVLRLGGLVEEDSVRRPAGDLQVRFAVTDTVHAVTVLYAGVLPDLFREGQGVVVRGTWRDNVLYADEVLAKHDENYTPPEVQEALRAARTLSP